MTTYFTDFSSYTAAAQPSDWTRRWVTTGVSFLVTTNAGFGGTKNGLVFAPTADGRFSLSWDAVDGDAGRANVELLYRWKSTTGTTPDARAMVRGSGNGTTTTEGYTLGPVNGIVRTAKYVAGAASTIGSDVSKTITANTWYWTRVRANGTALSIRTWADGGAEPGTWDINARTDSSVTAAGWVGFHQFVSAGDTTWDCVGIGTNGDTAPSTGSIAATGSGSLSLSASGAGRATGVASGNLSLSATGVAVAATGAGAGYGEGPYGDGLYGGTTSGGALSLSAAGNLLNGTASLSLSGAGATAGAGVASGSLSLSASGTTAVRATATAALSLTGAGTTTSPDAGTASLSLAAAGTPAATASGSGSLSLSATGTATGPNGADGTGSLSLSATGGATTTATSSAALSLTGSAATTSPDAGGGSLSLSAAATGAGAAVGSASLTLSAGAGAVPVPIAGTASLTLDATAALSAQVTGQALLTLGAIGIAHVEAAPTPGNRTLAVPLEHRVHLVASENRTLTVPAVVRALEVV